MKKRAEFGIAVWLTSDGDQIRADNHLQNLVERYFDMDWFKSQLDQFVKENFITEAEIESDPTFNPEEPNAPRVLGMDEIRRLYPELEYIQELTSYNVGEIPTIATKFERNGFPEIAEAIRVIAERASSDGFETVLRGDERPYHFAFKRGDIRVHFYSDTFAVEMDANRLNRDSAGRIIDLFFEMTGGNPKRTPPNFGLDLVSFGKDGEFKTKSLSFNNTNDFFDALAKFRRTALQQKIDLLLKVATYYYQRVIERP